MFKWKDEYSTGVQIIDEQHRKLFSIANDTFELLKNDFYFDKYNKIITLIEELKAYTLFHFKTEEEYMLSIGYRKFLSHKVQHDDFVNKFKDIDLDRIDKGQNAYIEELLKFIYAWIDEHILVKDRDYVSK